MHFLERAQIFQNLGGGQLAARGEPSTVVTARLASRDTQLCEIALAKWNSRITIYCNGVCVDSDNSTPPMWRTAL